MRIFVTGAAGFIGYHVSHRLLAQGHAVAGYDGMTNYYDVGLKQARLANLRQHQAFTFTSAMLEDRGALSKAVEQAEPEIVIHLAAQPGVRYALEAPDMYVQSNIEGTFRLLELLRRAPPRHLLFASSSSVYGGNQNVPSMETDRTDFPISLYAATKTAGEAMCHSYAHLFGVPTTSLRLFTAYGPWGRPDMALFKFVSAILAGRPIEIYGGGQMRRDFTYIDDLVDAVVALIPLAPAESSRTLSDSLSPVAPYRVVNIAAGRPTGLMQYVEAIEIATGRKAQISAMSMQPGDVVSTCGSPQLLQELVGASPGLPIHEGVSRFVRWYLDHYGARGA